MPSTSKLDGPLRVAVLKFKNVGADKELAGLELGIGETAVSAMSTAGGDVTLIERSDIESDIGELDRAKDEHFDKMTIAEKGKLEGVQVAVQGGFQRAGKLVRITARFVRVENGEIVDTLTVTKPARDVFGAQDEVASRLKQKLVALAALEKTKSKTVDALAHSCWSRRWRSCRSRICRAARAARRGDPRDGDDRSQGRAGPARSIERGNIDKIIAEQNLQAKKNGPRWPSRR